MKIGLRRKIVGWIIFIVDLFFAIAGYIKGIPLWSQGIIYCIIFGTLIWMLFPWLLKVLNPWFSKTHAITNLFFVVGLIFVIASSAFYIVLGISQRYEKAQNTFLKFQYFQDARPPMPIVLKNVQDWCFERNFINGSITDETIIICLDKHVSYSLVNVISTDFTLPIYEVKYRSERTILIHFYSKIPAGNIIISLI